MCFCWPIEYFALRCFWEVIPSFCSFIDNFQYQNSLCTGSPLPLWNSLSQSHWLCVSWVGFLFNGLVLLCEWNESFPRNHSFSCTWKTWFLEAKLDHVLECRLSLLLFWRFLLAAEVERAFCVWRVLLQTVFAWELGICSLNVVLDKRPMLESLKT